MVGEPWPLAVIVCLEEGLEERVDERSGSGAISSEEALLFVAQPEEAKENN